MVSTPDLAESRRAIFNLCPEKDAVMREVHRVLRPGRTAVFAEILLKGPLAEKEREKIDDWFRCIGGALPQPDFLARLCAAGLAGAQILWKGRNARTGHKLAVCAVIRAERRKQATVTFGRSMQERS